jgi:hypothetical protein
MHRAWQDAQVYFFFNESDQPQTIAATVQGRGQAQVWDANAAQISALTGAVPGDGTVRLPLEFRPHEARLIVIGAPVGVAAR